MRQVSVYTVRGHVYNGITQKPGTGVFLLLMPRGDNGDFESGYQRRVDKPDGTFTIPDVVPGSYHSPRCGLKTESITPPVFRWRSEMRTSKV